MINYLILFAISIFYLFQVRGLLRFILRIMIETDYVHYSLFRRGSIMDLEDRTKKQSENSDKTWEKLAKSIKKEKKVATNKNLSESFKNLRKKYMLEVISTSLYEREMQSMIQANIDALNGISIEKIKKNNPVFSRSTLRDVDHQIRQEADEWFKEWEEKPADYDY